MPSSHLSLIATCTSAQSKEAWTHIRFSPQNLLLFHFRPFFFPPHRVVLASGRWCYEAVLQILHALSLIAAWHQPRSQFFTRCPSCIGLAQNISVGLHLTGFVGSSSIFWEVEKHLISLVGTKHVHTKPASFSIVCISHDASYSSLRSARGPFQPEDEMKRMKNHRSCITMPRFKNLD